jgi:hypothetical protein
MGLGDGDGRRRGDGGRIDLDPSLAELIREQTGLFDAAFDTALKEGTAAAVEKLREVTDQLMRAGATVLIEIARISKS